MRAGQCSAVCGRGGVQFAMLTKFSFIGSVAVDGLLAKFSVLPWSKYTLQLTKHQPDAKKGRLPDRKRHLTKTVLLTMALICRTVQERFHHGQCVHGDISSNLGVVALCHKGLCAKPLRNSWCMFALLFCQHWVLNNIMGLAFCFNAIEMISLDRYACYAVSIGDCKTHIHCCYSVGVGCLLLGGLFLYDVFWVSTVALRWDVCVLSPVCVFLCRCLVPTSWLQWPRVSMLQLNVIYIFCPDRELCPIVEPVNLFANWQSGSGTGHQVLESEE